MMIRTVVTPDKDSILVSIPLAYVGKRVEVLVYSEEEAKPAPSTIDLASFSGALKLTDKQLTDFLRYVEQSRDEWERDF
jgi:hypothetical protein